MDALGAAPGLAALGFDDWRGHDELRFEHFRGTADGRHRFCRKFPAALGMRQSVGCFFISAETDVGTVQVTSA